jgi:hypothetical protein
MQALARIIQQRLSRGCRQVVRVMFLAGMNANSICDNHNTDPIGFETDVVSSEGGGATSDTDVRPHSLGHAAALSAATVATLRASEQQLRAEIQRLEQRYAQTVSSLTQERQEALANEAAFTRMARDSAQQLQLKLSDAESKIEFLAAFVSSQVIRFNLFGSCPVSSVTCRCRVTTSIFSCVRDALQAPLAPTPRRSKHPPPTVGAQRLQTMALMPGKGDKDGSDHDHAVSVHHGVT